MIDDLAHAAEVEAEVLRAVAHMTPAKAQEFLIAVALKIRRAATPMAAPRVTLPKLLASVVPESPPSRVRGARSIAVVRHLRASGGCTSKDLRVALGGDDPNERDLISATLGHLYRRGIVERDGDRYALPVNALAAEASNGTEGV
jgi:hypothetical protein